MLTIYNRYDFVRHRIGSRTQLTQLIFTSFSVENIIYKLFQTTNYIDEILFIWWLEH
jgi:hypothetical protein